MNELKNDVVKGTFDVETKVAVLSMEMEGRANKINAAFGLGLKAGLDWALGLPGVAGIVITSGHKDFCVGADIDGLFEERDAARMMENVKGLNKLYRSIETCGKPVVAALTGSALGGGYELALSCHRRIALDDARVQVGLPEVSLGVIPGAGGTQRLPRLVGLQAALELIAQGQMVRAPKAVAKGMVDEVQPTAEAVLAAAKKWIAQNPNAKQPWDQSGFKFPGFQPDSEEARNVYMAGCAMLEKKTAGVYLAPRAAISAVQEGAMVTFDRALEVEARHFVRLATGDQAKDMIRTNWYHRTAAEKQDGLPKTDRMDIQKVGILGAGMMGAGLAFVSAKAGFQVVLKDVSADALARARQHCESEVAELKHLSAAERKELLDRIVTTLEPAPLMGSDLIIEAVFEKLELKHAVNRELESLLSPRGIWASNTSAIPISDLAKSSQRPERFIGLHFFSPVEKMPLLEIVLGKATNEETLARSLAYTKAIKKTPIVVNDGYGFYTSRVFSAYIVEGAELVAEGHDPVLVEWAGRSAGMVVPPLQVFDEVSLSLGVHALEQAKAYLGDAVEIPGVQLVRKMLELGRAGKAKGAGFYDYEDGKRKGLWSGLRGLQASTPKKTGVELIRDRLMLIQCAEVARAIESGVIRDKRDAEVGALFGIGFAPNTGGPLSYMDRRGIKAVAKRLRELEGKHGARYACPPLLERMAERGERFFDA